MTNVEIVKHVYDRFTHGDAAGVLAAFDSNVEFRLAQSHPYQPEGKPWYGGEEITQNFFMKAGVEWQNWTIKIEAILDMGDAVVVECRYNGIYKPTGRTMDLQACHVWRFRNGKVISFHQYADTARLQYVMDSSGLTE